MFLIKRLVSTKRSSVERWTLDKRSSAIPGGNSHPECGPAPW